MLSRVTISQEKDQLDGSPYFIAVKKIPFSSAAYTLLRESLCLITKQLALCLQREIIGIG